MTIQRLWKFLPFVLAQRTACRSFTCLVLLTLTVMGLPALSGAQQTCQPDGDVDRNGNVTAADALLAFQQALGLAQLDACQLTIANVFPSPDAPDDNITASDALCIFQKALGLPSCLDPLPSPNEPPMADAGSDQTADAGTIVTLSGTADDTDGTIVSYEWEQTGGTRVSLTGPATATFTAPDVSTDETLTFQLTVTDDDGAQASDEVSVTVHRVNRSPDVNAGADQTVAEGTVVVLSGTASDPDGTIASYEWTQTGGMIVSLTGAASATAMFTAPNVSMDETLTFRLTVTDDDGATNSDDVSVTVTAGPGIDVAQYLTGPVERGESPGLFAAVIDEGGVRAVAAAGVRRQGSPEKLTVNDLVHVGSNTKAMTSTMLAALVEDDVFPHDWETTIADVFPELLEEIHPDYRAVDLFQLVRMTGGIPRNATNWWAHQDQPDIVERRYAILRDNLMQPPAGPVGEFLYSNLGYMIAGAMAERRTSESWEALMEEYLFAPLGITTAGFGPPGTPDAVDQPWGHYWNELGILTPVQFDNPEAVGPAGTVHISIEDWAKFVALWFPSQTPAILDRASLDELTDPDSGGYAAGWNVVQREWADGIALWHDGSNGVWRTVLWIAPELGIAYVAAANASDIFANDEIFWVLDGIVAGLINETLGSGQ